MSKTAVYRGADIGDKKDCLMIFLDKNHNFKNINIYIYIYILHFIPA